MELVTLRDFLTTGHLGSMRLGISRENVEGILGQCDTWSVGRKKYAKREYAKVWKYGVLELWFRDDTVSYLGLYPDLEVKLSDRMSIKGYFPHSFTTREEFEEYLRQENLSFHLDEKYPTDCGIQLIISNETYVVFHETQVIQSIYCIMP